jgi:magnesium-transporting ATPase (P-type)
MTEKMKKTESKATTPLIDVRILAQVIFLITLTMSIIIFTNMYMANKEQRSEGYYWTQRATMEENAAWCNEIDNLQYEVQCYSIFIKKGYNCNEQERSTKSKGCLIAFAVQNQDELLCDEYFPPEELPYNLECRVTLFIERYTNEGISDCCHI